MLDLITTAQSSLPLCNIFTGSGGQDEVNFGGHLTASNGGSNVSYIETFSSTHLSFKDLWLDLAYLDNPK